MSTYLVTGGAGFIGSHLTDALLAAGHAVRVLDDFSTGRAANLDPRCEVVTGDVADASLVRDALAGAECCFHLAAVASVVRSQADWPGTHRVNQGGTVAVLDAARAGGGIPVVYASSAAVYGDVGDRAASEALCPAPTTAYGADKLGSELHARVGFAVHGVPSIGLRFFNVYGPRQDAASPYSGVISLFAARIAEGAPVTLHGDGEQTRDFVFVGDVVAHLRAAMAYLGRAPGAWVCNVCTGRETSVLGLAEALSRLCRTNTPVAHGASRAGDIRRSVGAPERARSMLEVRAAVALDDGLNSLLSFATQDR